MFYKKVPNSKRGKHASGCGGARAYQFPSLTVMSLGVYRCAIGNNPQKQTEQMKAYLYSCDNIITVMV